MMVATGLDPDPWQTSYLRSEAERLLLLCFRQSGKSTATAALALTTAIYEPESLVLLLSPSLRQSGELYKKVYDGYERLGRPIAVVEDSATTLALANGSRVVSLPGRPETIRGYSAPQLVVIDEAAQADDDLFVAVNPMLAVSRGRLVIASTPFGKRGFYYDQWNNGGPEWGRIKVTAYDCPRIDSAWLAEQRTILGERWFNQEFLCEFVETTGQVFSTESIEAAFRSDRPPLFAGLSGGAFS
jgi:hypothetical protein